MANKFKVGDRVRVLVKTGLRMYDVGTTCEVVDVCDDGVLLNSNGRGNLFYDFCDLEPIAVADSNSNNNTLRIEEGKCYRTRDGRKVGPARYYDSGDGYPFEMEFGFWVSPSGIRQRDDRSTDLIAEWPSEKKRYSSCEAAQIDVQRDEYGPFGAAREVVVDGRIVKSVFADTRRPAIVALIDNGQPKPSERPHVHADAKAATAEAERLAGKHPGKEFGVYELVATRREEPKHEWQKLALAGRVDEATDALIEAAGVDRWSAQNAIQMMRAA